MGHRSWMGNQCFSAAQADRQLHDLEIIEQREGLLLTALDIKSERRARRRALPVEYRLARVAFLEETEIMHLGDFRMSRQIFGDEPGVLIRARRANLKRF